MMRRCIWFGVLLTAALTGASCAAGQAFKQGNTAVAKGDLDQAVEYYRKASQADPDNGDYMVALQKSMQAASRAHFEKAKAFEEQGQLEAAVGEYTRASEFDASNRMAATKARDLDRIIRQRADASRPRPFQDMQARARASSPIPILNPASRDPITLNAVNTPIRDILTSLANSAGIDVLYDRDAESQVLTRPFTADLQGLTFEQALNFVMGANQLSFKVISPRTILVFQDVANKHAIYDDQVIQTFQISHVDPAQLVGVIGAVTRITGLGVQPLIQANPSNNTIIAKATVPIMQIIEKIIQQNDKPPAEVVIDVEILEVSRQRIKTYGLNLSEYALGAAFSPEVAPGGANATIGIPPAPPINLNTISRGVSTSDFYLAVPTAIVRMLESDQHTKFLARPQLRGAEGQKLSLRLGDKVPIPSTTFTPIATGGATTNPLTTFQYTDVGVIIDITPRVTVDGDIILDVLVDNSSLGQDIVVNDVSAPTIGTRSVTSRLRLRDGESNLIAGLFREDDRKFVQGFPGLVNLPFFRQVLSGNDNQTTTTDIVMLLTPRIVRGKDITEEDLKPIYIGSGQAFGLNGPPPLIGLPDLNAPATPAPGTPPPGTPGAAAPPQLIVPPGSSPVPGLVPAPTALPQAVPVPSTAPASTVPPAIVPPPPDPISTTPGAAPVTPSSAASSQVGQPTTAGALGTAQIGITPPNTPMRVGGGPYTIPITVANATRLTTISVSVTFDPSRLRVRSVQEGSFMRSGGVNATFTQQVSPGRVDIAIIRAGDATGASGTGLLGAILFDTIAPGQTPLTLSGVATGPGGAAAGLQARPTVVNIEQ